jgi:hypothetical protein
MSERTPIDAFEARLATLVRSYTDTAASPIDPLVTARMAMASSPRAGVLARLWGPLAARRMVWLLLLAALIIAIAALAVAVGSGPSLFPPVPDGPGRIVFVRDGDLFVAETDGSGQRQIRSGLADAGKFGYLTAAWSPDMRHIAAVRDIGGEFLTPNVDLMTEDGVLVRTVALDAGCGPSVTWSPEGTNVAIATCPAEVPRDAIESVESGIGLLIAGLDPSTDREIALPPDWQSVASARREVWIRPDLWARWSPDGRWIAIWAIVAGQSGRYLVAADGSGTRRIEELTTGLNRVDSFDWSPDGRSLAISGGLVGCADEVCLGVVDVESRTLTSTVQHPSAGDPNLHGKLFWPEFSPAGDRVAVLGGLIDLSSEPTVETSTLYTHDLATARFTELTSGSRSLILDSTGAVHSTRAWTGELVADGSAAWSADGRQVLYLVRGGGDAAASWSIHSIDAAGANQSTVLVRDVQSFDLGWERP